MPCILLRMQETTEALIMKRHYEDTSTYEDILFPTDSVVGAKNPVGFFCFSYRGYGIGVYTPNVPLLSFTNYPADHEQRVGATVEVELDGVHPLEGFAVQGKEAIYFYSTVATVARIHVSNDGRHWTALNVKAEIHTEILPLGLGGDPHDDGIPYDFYFALPRTGVRARFWRFVLEYNPRGGSLDNRYTTNNFEIHSLEGGICVNESDVLFDYHECRHEQLDPTYWSLDFYENIHNVAVSTFLRLGAPPEIAFYRKDDTQLSESSFDPFPKTEFLDIESCTADRNAVPYGRSRHVSQIYRDGYGLGVPWEQPGVYLRTVPNHPQQERAEHTTFGLCDDPDNGVQIDNLNTDNEYTVKNRLGVTPDVVLALVDDYIPSQNTNSYIWYSGLSANQARLHYNFYPQSQYPGETNFDVSASAIQVYRDDPTKLVKIIALKSNGTTCIVGTYVGTGAQQEITASMPVQIVFIKSLEIDSVKTQHQRFVYNLWTGGTQSIDEGRIGTGDPYTFEVGTDNQNVNQLGTTYMYIGFNVYPGSIEL